MAIAIYSWNVNGIRAVWKKGFVDWLKKTKPDVVGLQETKIQEDQLTPEMRGVCNYDTYWHCAQKKGYSSVAIFTRYAPHQITNGLGIEKFDAEGRVITIDCDDFMFLNIYFPNGERDATRLKYKMDFYDAVLEHCKKLRKKGRKLVVSGDYNTAHTEIDLAHPKENSKRSGFLPEERAWIDKWIAHGFVDIFRKFHPDQREQYTWWDQRTGARARNVGWRIDYHFVSEDLVAKVSEAKIHPEVMGSDHCPVSIVLK